MLIPLLCGRVQPAALCSRDHLWHLAECTVRVLLPHCTSNEQVQLAPRPSGTLLSNSCVASVRSLLTSSLHGFLTGKDLVLWSSKGQWKAFVDLCPHRSVLPAFCVFYHSNVADKDIPVTSAAYVYVLKCPNWKPVSVINAIVQSAATTQLRAHLPVQEPLSSAAFHLCLSLHSAFISVTVITSWSLVKRLKPVKSMASAASPYPLLFPCGAEHKKGQKPHLLGEQFQ